MPTLDEAVLGDPVRLAAVDRARRVAVTLPLPLNAIARLSARLLRAPMAVVTFVGQAQEHFAGAHGLPDELAAHRQAPIAYSLCKYVVSVDSPFGCPDMHDEADAELRNHPAAIEYGVRSFLGVPLRDGDHQPVGAISVFDTVARQWTDEEFTALAETAELVGPIPVDTAPTPATLDSSLLLDSVQEAFIAVDVEGRVVGWNRAAEDLLGFTAGEAYGRPLAETALPEYDGQPIRASLAGLFEDPAITAAPRDVVARHRDGHPVPARVSLSVVRGRDGALACAFLSDLRDLTAAQDNAERQRGFLAALLENLAVGVAACDAEGRLVLVNRTLRQVHGLPETGELSPAQLAAALAGLHHPDGTAMRPLEVPLRRSWAGEHVRDADLVIYPPDGRRRTFATNSQPIRGDDGRTLGAVATLHEVTAVRRAEQFRACQLQVRETLAGAASVAGAAPLVLRSVATTLDWPHAELWLIDPVTDSLRSAGHWTAPGRQLDDLMGNTVVKGTGITGTVWATGQPLWVPDITDTTHLVTEDSLARARACLQHGLRTVLAVPVRDGDTMLGVLTCFAGTPEYHEDLLTVLLTGVAAQIGQFVALRRAEDLTRQLMRSRDDFITLVGHEMRTPLTSIAAYAAMLGDDPGSLGDETRLMVQAIERNTATLRDIIDNLLELAALESGHAQLVGRPLDLVEVVAGAVPTAVPADSGVRIWVEAPAQLTMSGDEHRLRQVVDHLLSNAVRYSPAGGDVRVVLREVAGAVELAVTDPGIGVPADEHDQLFQRFFRASNVRHQGIAGTGLGLSLVRAIVELHGGTVTLADHRPTGTTVLVRLPLVADSPAD